MSLLTSYTDKVIRERAMHVAEKKMQPAWDRRNSVLLNVYHAYFIEALCIEYNELVVQAHAHGWIGALGKNKLVASLNGFYEEIK